MLTLLLSLSVLKSAPTPPPTTILLIISCLIVNEIYLFLNHISNLKN